MLECLEQLDATFFSLYAKDMFKNVTDLNTIQLNAACENNWNVIYKALKSFLDKENLQDNYIDDIQLDLIIEGDKSELSGFFLCLISVVLMKKRYVWNQSLGKIQSSETYNFLKDLEKALNVTEEIDDTPKMTTSLTEADKDESQTLVDMITDLETKIKAETDSSSKLSRELETKKEELDEVKKLHEQKTFESEKMRVRLEALELSQKEYYDAMAIQKDLNLLDSQVKKLEKREEDLEMENSFLRDKINEQDKKIKELKEIESKYQVDENMRKKFEMVLERNDLMNVDSRKKDLEIEGLKYQVELLKKNKEAIENALITTKNEKLKLDQEVNNQGEEMKSKDQEIKNLEQIIHKLKDNIEVNNLLTTQNTLTSPTFKSKRRLHL